MDKGHISIQINHIGIVNDIKENYLLDQNHYEKYIMIGIRK